MERNITDRKILEIRNLTKGFGSRGGYETRVIKGISMDIFPGDFIAVMGPSGAGKTTLLNLLSTLDKPDGGQILLDGENLEKVGNKRLSEIRRDKIGFIFQEYNLLDNMSLEDNIALPLSLNGVKSTEVRRRVQKMAAVFGLTEHLKKYPYQLSGGQKQRGAGARALVTEPADSLRTTSPPEPSIPARAGIFSSAWSQPTGPEMRQSLWLPMTHMRRAMRNRSIFWQTARSAAGL